MNMIPFAGSAFWFATITFIAIYSFLGNTRAFLRLKNLYMISVSLFVVSLAVSNALVLIPLLLAVLVVVYFIGKRALEEEDNGTYILVYTVVLFILLLLCFFKYSIVQSLFLQLFEFILSPLSTPSFYEGHIYFVGVSYFTFKFIHFIIECKNKKIKSLSFMVFLNYILFFPSFFSGPINRYNSFSQSIAGEVRLIDNFVGGAKRVVNGLFKKIVLGDSLLAFSIATLDLGSANIVDVIIGVYAYMFYIYFNFSGYTDMAIGVGKMVGVDLPENFNYPFFKRNLQQFWANWHMSLTAWLTDYIYWPLARKLRNVQKLRKKPVTNSNICIVITFLACGLWHGDGLNFILWGVYHGIGLALLNMYTHLVKKYASRNIKKIVRNSPIVYGLSNVITFQYVAFGFLLFSCDMERLSVVFNIVI